MSIMTRGIIGMPYKIAMNSELSRRQFYSHAQVLLAEYDQLKAENEALRKDAERLNWLTAQGEIEQPGQGDVRGYIDKAMGKEPSHD